MLGDCIQLRQASIQLRPYGKLFPSHLFYRDNLLIVQNDPHGAAFWLDFLAIKSGNHAWVLSMFEDHSEQYPVAVFQGYPGMAFAYALACRAREDAEKDRVRHLSLYSTKLFGELMSRIVRGVMMLCVRLSWRSRRPSYPSQTKLGRTYLARPDLTA